MRKSRFYIAASLLIFISSFFFIVIRDTKHYGYEAFFIGFNGFYFSNIEILIPWLANFLFAGSLLIRRRRGWSLILAMTAVLFSVSLLFTFDARSGLIAEIKTRPLLGPGYFMWVISFIVNLAGALVVCLNDKRDSSKWNA